MGRVSRNKVIISFRERYVVAPRMGRVSRNSGEDVFQHKNGRRAPHGACE